MSCANSVASRRVYLASRLYAHIVQSREVTPGCYYSSRREKEDLKYRFRTHGPKHNYTHQKVTGIAARHVAASSSFCVHSTHVVSWHLRIVLSSKRPTRIIHFSHFSFPLTKRLLVPPPPPPVILLHISVHNGTDPTCWQRRWQLQQLHRKNA